MTDRPLDGRGLVALYAGDVVRLKSGGMLMTVMSDACCGHIHVAWASAGALEQEDIPRQCLELVDPDTVDRVRSLAENIPF